jgi:hypothetical protein
MITERVIPFRSMAVERESYVIPSAARDLALEVWDILVSSSAQSSFVRSFTSFRMTCAVFLDRACKRRSCFMELPQERIALFQKSCSVSIRL